MASKPAQGVEFDVKPTSQLDLEAFQAREAGEAPADEAANSRKFDGDTEAFAGVAPEYANYADDTGKPFLAEGDGAEAKAEKKQLEAQEAAGGTTVVGGVVTDEKIAQANADLGGGEPPAEDDDDDGKGKAAAPAKE